MLNYVKMITDFPEFVLAEMKARGWSQADLARRTGMTTGGVSMLLTQTRKPSPDTLNLLASVFDLPPEFIFRRAGILPTESVETEARELLNHFFDGLPEEGKEDLVEYARFLKARYAGNA